MGSITAAELLPVLRALCRELGTDRLPTDEAVVALSAWSGQPITANRLARTLKPLGIAPRQFRVRGERRWGYLLTDLAESRDVVLLPVAAQAAQNRLTYFRGSFHKHSRLS